MQFLVPAPSVDWLMRALPTAPFETVVISDVSDPFGVASSPLPETSGSTVDPLSFMCHTPAKSLQVSVDTTEEADAAPQ